MFGRGKTESKKMHRDGAAPRPRVRPLWRRTGAVSAMSAVVMAILAGGGWYLTSTGAVARGIDHVRWAAISTTASMGFRVQEVMVSGRQQTDRDTLIKSLNIARGAPILAFDIDDAKRRVEALPWVRATTIERMLPDTILVSIVEREPLALWQREGNLHLVDADGVVILDKGLDAYKDLMLVIGDGAQSRAAELIALLGTEPVLMHQVTAATWVGQRRWNLHLRDGIVVRLPESDPISAWGKLAEYHRLHRVFDKDVTVLDLRIPDRLIVRKGPKEAGQET